MPTGDVPLLLAVGYNDGNPLRDSVLDTLIEESIVAEMFPWLPFTGEVYVVREVDKRPSVSFRAVNAGYTRTYGTEKKHYFGISIAGGEVAIDNFLLKVRGDTPAQKARQYMQAAKQAARFLNRNVIDGDGTGDSFKGMNASIDDGWGRKIPIAANGSTILAAGLDVLDEAIDACHRHPDALLMNKHVRRQITHYARGTSREWSMLDVGHDALGRKVTHYDDVPIKLIGQDDNGNWILDFDETQGSASGVCSSIYAVCFGEEDGVFGLLGAGGSFEVRDFGELQDEPKHMGRIEFYPGFVVANPFALVRITGIKHAKGS